MNLRILVKPPQIKSLRLKQQVHLQHRGDALEVLSSAAMPVMSIARPTVGFRLGPSGTEVDIQGCVNDPEGKEQPISMTLG